MSLSRLFSRRLLAVALAGCLAQSAFGNNVTALLEGSLLTVTGDNASNSVLISRSSTGDVTVTGRNGTRVNGVAFARFPRLQLNAAEIRMEGGNDSVTLQGIRTGNDLYINLGSGADGLNTTAPVTVGANLTIEAAEGADNIQLTGLTAAEDIYIDGGLDALTVALSGLDAGKSLTIISDAARDVVTVSDSMVAEVLSIESKAGNNSINVTRVMAFSAFVTTDLGADSISIQDLATAEDVGVFSGAGNDIVALTNLNSGKSVIVSVDAGADRVTGTSVSAAEDAVFEGGAGTDTLTDLGIVGGVKKEVKEFEVLLP
jgi:hypothetical protein